MENDIDFMAEIDESITLEHAIKMIHAARRGYLKALEREAIASNEVAHLKIKLYGKSSEKKPKPASPDPQIFDEVKASDEDLLKDDAINIANEALEDSIQAIEVTPSKPEAKAKGRKPIPKSYPRFDVIHDLAEAQKICACGCTMTKFGEDVSEQFDVIPAKIYVKRHRRFKYACKSCQEGVKIAPVQSQSVAKCLAAPGLLAHTAVAKFDDHLPLYRQCEIWERLGVELSRSTLSSWVLKMGIALEPLVTFLQNHIIQSGYVKADETTCQVLKTPGKSDKTNSYMWVYMTGNNPKPAVVYDYQQSRKGEFAEKFLTGFKGVLQSDGYSGYHCITAQDHVRGIGCFAHARRKFHDVWVVAKTEGIASKALDIIGKLYGVEDEIKDKSASEKQKIREEKSKPILDAFHIWLLEIKPNVQAKGLLDKAIQYALNQWDSLTYYVKDGSLNIDNNAAERQIRPFAIGRKNWLFMGNPKGAKAAATLYSLIETAKLNGLNPEGYLKFVLEHIIDPKDAALLEKLMPWNVIVPEGYLKPNLLPVSELESEENSS